MDPKGEFLIANSAQKMKKAGGKTGLFSKREKSDYSASADSTSRSTISTYAMGALSPVR